MEYKTCEEYVLNELKLAQNEFYDVKNENEQIKLENEQIKLENEKLKKEILDAEIHYKNLLKLLVKDFQNKGVYSELDIYFWNEPKEIELLKLYNDLRELKMEEK